MLVYAAGVLSVLVTVCALVLDIGWLEQTKVRMQSAAEAAAFAAVLHYDNGGTVYVTGGTTQATLNGFTANSNTTVSITNPPASGAYSGNSYVVQATITQSLGSVFLPKMLTTLKASAAAMRIPTPCVFMMSSYSTSPSLTISNQQNSYSCPTYLAKSFLLQGGSTVTGSQFFVASNSSSSTGSPATAAIFGAPAQADPLGYLAPPAVGACAYTNYSNNSSATLSPGTYCGGITLTGNGTFTFNSGTYVLTGPLSINGPNVNGSGVTFYVAQTSAGSVVQNTKAVLSAPTSGTYQGILYYSDRSIAAGSANLTMQNWNPSSTIDGILYAPNQQFSTSNITLAPLQYLAIVADYSSMNNTSFSPAANYSSLANGNPLHPVGGSGGIVE